MHLPEDIENRLTILAERTERSKTFHIVEATRKLLDDLEDMFVSEAVLERVRNGEERVYTSKEMEELPEMVGN